MIHATIFIDDMHYFHPVVSCFHSNMLPMAPTPPLEGAEGEGQGEVTVVMSPHTHRILSITTCNRFKAPNNSHNNNSNNNNNNITCVTCLSSFYAVCFSQSFSLTTSYPYSIPNNVTFTITAATTAAAVYLPIQSVLLRN